MPLVIVEDPGGDWFACPGVAQRTAQGMNPAALKPPRARKVLSNQELLARLAIGPDG